MFSKKIISISSALAITLFSTVASANDSILVNSVKDDVSKANINASFWNKAKDFTVSLMAQPMTLPKPEKTETSLVKVKAVHNGKWISFKLNWKDAEKSEAGPLGKFSDGIAIEFPVKLANGEPPSAFMGQTGSPVHIYHWKAAFQLDKDKGFHTMKDIYPNASIDMYPLEPKIDGNYPKATEEQKNVFSHGKAAGNPQAYPKTKALDEIYAEGFGTSQVIDNHEAIANGEWKNGEWNVVISRPLKAKVGSSLETGKPNFICFAVWQGGKSEVGSRKAVSLVWTPLELKK